MSTIAELPKLLEGRYRYFYYEINGQVVEPPNAASTRTLELRGNQFTVLQNEKVTHEGTYTIGPVRRDEHAPVEVVLKYSKSANPLYLGAPRAGLLQFHGDTLKWNLGAAGHSAPKQLTTYPGSESVLSVYVKEGAKLDAPERGISTLRTVSVW